MLFSRPLPPALHSGARHRPVLPGLCAVCHGWGDARVCGACRQRFLLVEPRCQRCAIEVPAGVAVCGDCLRVPPAFDHCVAAVRYDYPWDSLLASFKFAAALDLAPALARALCDAVERAALPRCDWILPVPLSARRLQERGYNQAWELARRLARDLPGRADARLLLRLKDTLHQSDLPRARRAANVRGAFMAEPRRAAALRGATVAVVDDVMTTGSTLDEIARSLKQAGAAAVQCWVVARTPKE